MSIETSPSLLTHMRHGSVSAWTEFHRRYSGMLLAIAKGRGLSDQDALDVVQETETAVFTELQKLEGSFDRDKRPFKYWLGTIAKYKLCNVCAGNRRWRRGIDHAFESIESAEDDGGFNASYEREWSRHVINLAFERIVNRVSEQIYQVLELTLRYGKSPKEVARLLSMTPNAVRIAKCKGLRILRQVIRQIEKEELGDEEVS